MKPVLLLSLLCLSCVSVASADTASASHAYLCIKDSCCVTMDALSAACPAEASLFLSSQYISLTCRLHLQCNCMFVVSGPCAVEPALTVTIFELISYFC